MGDSIKLTDAIEANENGIVSLERTRDRYREDEKKNREKAEEINREINARLEMTNAMRKLQRLYPDNETIRFTIP